MWSPSDEFRLLTRHFLRRFVENDLISPQSDRHETLALAASVLINAGLFVTLLLSLKYLFDNFPSPARTSLAALDDVFFYTASSMIVMALAAVVEWDALALDPRDTSILGPLPLPHGVIVRAKLATLGLFAAGVALALNAVPALLHPTLLAAKLPVGAMGVLRLVLAHAVSTMAAGAFAFLSVLALRELVRALLGAVWFERVSRPLQFSLLAGLATIGLLVPALFTEVGAGLSGSARPYANPAAWFVGVHEVVAGGTIQGLPPGNLPRMIGHYEREAARLLAGVRPLFGGLAVVGAIALAAAGLAAASGYAWNSRRLPAPGTSRRRRRARGLADRAARVLVRHPVARGGFSLTIGTLFRSGPHRATVAVSAALGLTAAVVSLRGIGEVPPADVRGVPLAWLAVQAVVLAALCLGFRHATRIPAHLPAGWIVQLAWSGHARQFIAGVKRAGLAMLVVPALLVLLPAHLWMLGAGTGLAHLAAGLVVALALMEFLFLRPRACPLVASYVPVANLKFAGPLIVASVLLGAYALAYVERLVLTSARATVISLAVAAALLVLARLIDRWAAGDVSEMTFEEPSEDVLRLDLGG